MAIISLALLCLGDIKLFAGIIGFSPEQTDTRTYMRKQMHVHALKYTQARLSLYTFHVAPNVLRFASLLAMEGVSAFPCV